MMKLEGEGQTMGARITIATLERESRAEWALAYLLPSK